MRLKAATVVLGLCVAMGPALASGETVGAAGGEPVVQVDGEALDIDAALRPFALQILRFESQAYALRRRAIDDAVAKRLIEREAAKRSLTTQALLALEVDAKIVPPTEVEVDARTASRGGAAGSTEAEIAETRVAIRASMVEQRRAEQRAQFVAALRANAAVTIEGLAPPALKTAIATAGEPSLGPADAPVTIVEFSDYQCPHCRQSQATLKTLLRRYPGKVRLVHRDYPVPQLHPGAAAAAEAARCAGEQEAFWPYHDLLYANPTKQAENDLVRYANEDWGSTARGSGSACGRAATRLPLPAAWPTDGSLAWWGRRHSS